MNCYATAMKQATLCRCEMDFRWVSRKRPFSHCVKQSLVMASLSGWGGVISYGSVMPIYFSAEHSNRYLCILKGTSQKYCG